MTQYIIEAIAIQLVFLVIYDLFLKRETFFQWNRLYLIGTYVLSFVLPWVKIEALKTSVPEQYYVYPKFLWPTEAVADQVIIETTKHQAVDWSWQEGILYCGMLLAGFYFVLKLYRIYRLRKIGSVRYFPNFTRVVVAQSELAFSFFRYIFLGDKIMQREHDNIIKHELVHIRQKHSWDLIFFELMRICCWFNPLVYVYQSRISELHEFIADAAVAKTDKKEQYQLLLSEVFQTEHISFINHFFKSSLVKKRIVMLQKSKSKRVWKLKYLALVPLIIGILIYTSSDAQEVVNQDVALLTQSEDTDLIDKVKTNIVKEVAELGSLKKVHFSHHGRSHIAESDGPLLEKEAYFESAILFNMMMEEMSEKMAETKTGGEQYKYETRMVEPSTVRYESYVTRKEAFQILDKNLKFSISYNIRDIPIEVRKIDTKANYPDTFDIYEVADVTDLTGIEIRKFNHKIDAIFKEGNSRFTDLILKDGHYSFQIFKGIPMIGLNYYPKLSSESNKVSENGKSSVTSLAQVEEVPVFPGCEDSSDKRACFTEQLEVHISKNFHYPKEASENGIQGAVYILFTIDENGDIADFRKRGPNALLEAEAERIISKLPRMKPGKNKGKAVKVQYTVPITFKL